MQQLNPAISELKDKGNAAFKQKQYSEAVKWYSQAIRGCPDGPAAVPLYSNRSAAHFQLGRYEDALGDACNSVNIDITWSKGYYRAAKAMMGLGRPEDALYMVEAAAKHCGKPSEEISQLLDEALLKVEQKKAAEPDSKDASTPSHGTSAPSHGTTAASSSNNPPRAADESDSLPFRALPHLSCTSLEPSVIPKELRRGHVFQPSSDGVNENLLLLLHGCGDSAAPFARLAAKMSLPQTASLALNGPLGVPLWEKGRQWFQMFQPDGELIAPTASGKARAEGLERSVSLLRQLLTNLKAVGWSRKKVQLFGFSQGGTVALHLARSCCGAEKLGGCVVVSSSVLEEELMAAGEQNGGSATGQQLQGAGGGGMCPVLFIHGSEDQTVPLHLVERSRRLLEQCSQTITTGAGASDSSLGTSSSTSNSTSNSSSHTTTTTTTNTGTSKSVEVCIIPGKGHGMLGSETEMRAAMSFWGSTLSHRPLGREDLVEVPAG